MMLRALLTVIADAARQALGDRPARPAGSPIRLPNGTFLFIGNNLGASTERGQR